MVEAQSERWTRDVRGLLDADSTEPPPAPAGLAAHLRPYQLEGYGWLSFLWDHRLGGVLADDMGLGKTLQTLALLCRAQEAGELDAAPVLVVAHGALFRALRAEMGLEPNVRTPNAMPLFCEPGAPWSLTPAAVAVAG